MISSPIRAIRVGTQFVENIADRLHDLDVALLVTSADIVGLADNAIARHEHQGRGMVFDIEPVADVFASPVNRKRLSLDGVEDHQRNELFRKVIGAIII